MMNNYIYKFLNYEDKIIYVGKTKDIKRRMKQHFGSSSHLSKECYEQINKIFFANVDSKFNAEFFETYFIKKYHPEYNTDKNYKENFNDVNIQIKEPIWRELFFNKIKTKNNINSLEFISDNNLPYLNKNLMTKEAIDKAINFNINKLECYEYEFRHFCPNFFKILNNSLDEIHKLIYYIQKNINIEETNIDEYITSNREEQLKDNYIAFYMNDIITLSKEVKLFHIFLKFGLVENLSKNIFIFNMLSVTLLKNIENNIKKTTL